MQNVYSEIRFNLTFEQANASIMREITAYKKELDDFWFTWIKSPKIIK